MARVVVGEEAFENFICCGGEVGGKILERVFIQHVQEGVDGGSEDGLGLGGGGGHEVEQVCNQVGEDRGIVSFVARKQTKNFLKSMQGLD